MCYEVGRDSSKMKRIAEWNTVEASANSQRYSNRGFKVLAGQAKAAIIQFQFSSWLFVSFYPLCKYKDSYFPFDMSIFVG